MAKKPDPSTETETVPKKRKGSIVLVWVLMAMLVAGLGGFGVTNFGGGTASIATVGDRPIEVTDYARALQQELQAFSAQIGQPVTMEQAQTLGLDRQVRQRLITAAALDNEAARIGLSVGDDRVAQEIMSNDAFKGVTGTFDRETYRFTLERNNLTEPAFEARVREDLSRSLMQGAVAGGFAAPAPMVSALQGWIGEKRGFTLLRLTEADLPVPLPDPTDADLQAFYDANGALFTAPEAKRITYAALLPEMLRLWREGTDVVYAVRQTRDDQSTLQVSLTGLFYKLVNWGSRVKIPPNAGDFRLMDRKVVEALKSMPERNRFMKGLYAWVGFNSTAIAYQPLARLDGRSNFGLRGAMSLALDAVLAWLPTGGGAGISRKAKGSQLLPSQTKVTKARPLMIQRMRPPRPRAQASQAMVSSKASMALAPSMPVC